MRADRYRLRLFYLALCAAQLVVMGLGLVVAYEVQYSYSQNIEYEKAVNAERRKIDELAIYARVASPETLNLDDASSGPAQLSEIAYSAGIFLKKAQVLLQDAQSSPNSPLARSQPDLQDLVAQMTSLAEQSHLAGEAWASNDPNMARAKLTYADRAAARVQTALGNINQQMAREKDEILDRDSREARRAQYVLGPLSALGMLLLLPALLYARRLNHNIAKYKSQLEEERGLLEERVARRTQELRSEIEFRRQVESFNGSRNSLLEGVAEAKSLDEILAQLVEATEQSIAGGRCLISVSREGDPVLLAPRIAADLAAQLHAAALRCCDSIPAADADRGASFVRVLNPTAEDVCRLALNEGFRAVFTAPIREPHQPLQGVIVLLLPVGRGHDHFAREVLLSASRVASVALKHGRMQQELFRRAHYDPLTSLPNRALFDDRLQQAVAFAARRGTQVGVLCIDLDDFKQVNDVHGHQAGDSLLQQVAGRLTAQLRQTDTVARLGGDEFAAVIQDTHGGTGVAQVGEAMVRLLSEPYAIGSAMVRTTASIGAAIFPADGLSCDELRRHADLALYRAKERGRNTYQMFSTELGERLERRKQIESYLQDALVNDGFELFYQPIYSLSERIVGFEALIRFSHLDRRAISPSEFMVVAEQTGMSQTITEWVIREACQQGKRWQVDGLGPVPIAVNISAIDLARANFPERVTQILEETGLDPRWLHVEVTETAIMCDFEAGCRALNALAESGVHIAIDDFGTGHSSLSYIHRLPIRTVKIDRSFVQDMVGSQESKAIVCAIVAMARSLGLTVIAEGVETEEQLAAVARERCDAAQGYLFAKPLDHAAAGLLIARTRDGILLARDSIRA